MGYIFQREILDCDLLYQAMPLFNEHHQEVGVFKETKLDPDFDKYLTLEKAGIIRFYTAREDVAGALVGYSCFFVNNHMHHMSSTQAIQDLIFITKLHRGFGHKFISWCSEQLFKEGCEIVYQTVKASHNFGSILERQGYELVDLVYARRLNG